jgi:hypothetical protein
MKGDSIKIWPEYVRRAWYLQLRGRKTKAQLLPVGVV